MRWEYEVITVYMPNVPETLEDLGAAGWELVNVTNDEYLDTYKVLYFKRPYESKDVLIEPL